MKYNLPKPYISYSQVRLYLEDPKGYYEQYILGKDFMAEMKLTDLGRWEKIRLGAIFQDAWWNPLFDWRRELKRDHFTPDKERIIAKALEQKNLLRLPTKLCEQTYRMNFGDIPLLIKPDGFDPERKLLIENKFGSPRNQEWADEDLQISFYSLGIKLRWGFIPKVVCQSVSDKNGSVKAIKTQRRASDLKHCQELIKVAVNGISQGIWEK